MVDNRFLWIYHCENIHERNRFAQSLPVSQQGQNQQSDKERARVKKKKKKKSRLGLNMTMYIVAVVVVGVEEGGKYSKRQGVDDD